MKIKKKLVFLIATTMIVSQAIAVSAATQTTIKDVTTKVISVKPIKKQVTKTSTNKAELTPTISYNDGKYTGVLKIKSIVEKKQTQTIVGTVRYVEEVAYFTTKTFPKTKKYNKDGYVGVLKASKVVERDSTAGSKVYVVTYSGTARQADTKKITTQYVGLYEGVVTPLIYTTN